MDADGSASRRLTRSQDDDYLAPKRLAAQQTKGTSAPLAAVIVLTASEGPAGHRERLGLLGWQPPQLKHVGPVSGRVRSPSWFPDGRSMVFEADLNGFRDLYRLRVDDGRVERLTKESAGCFEPTLDPRGKAVAFVSSRDGDPEIYRLDLARKSLTRLTWSRGDDSSPLWSPDGRHIAFSSARRGSIPQLFVMRPDGSKPRLLLAARPGALAQRDARWSPDGRYLALVEQAAGRAGLRVVRLSDGAQVGASDGRWIDQSPAWSPDGDRLVFASDRDGDTELYRMERDGSATKRLTISPRADWLPQWLAGRHMVAGH